MDLNDYVTGATIGGREYTAEECRAIAAESWERFAAAAARARCFRCDSHDCYTRINTFDGRFDEVACREHSRDLERHADAVLGSGEGAANRLHTSSTSRLMRRATR